jgi:chemotaxis response regulator CheB
MAEILTGHTAFTVKMAKEGDCLTPGMAYIAPPNHHLLVKSDGTLSLSQSKCPLPLPMTSVEKDPEFENLLVYLRQSRGFDFTTAAGGERNLIF